MQPLECEWKWALDASEYERLQRAIPDWLGRSGRRQRQRNRFLDTEDGALRRAGFGCRLRLVDQRLVLTCKRRRSQEDGYYIADEFESTVNTAAWAAVAEASETAQEWLPLPAAVARTCAGHPLRCHGGFDNLRLSWWSDGEEIALDRTVFPPSGLVDHELEIETTAPSTSRQRWQERFNRLGIAMRAQPASKQERLWRLLSGHNGSLLA